MKKNKSVYSLVLTFVLSMTAALVSPGGQDEAGGGDSGHGAVKTKLTHR